MIPYSKQHISKKDITAVTKVLQSEFITQGPVNINFEKAISSKFNSKYCFSMNSASSALHAACLALGLTKGDILWTVPNTFVASANCGINCGAKIDFVDIDNLTYNMDCNFLKS